MRITGKKIRAAAIFLSVALFMTMWRIPAAASSKKAGSLTSDSIKKKEGQIAQMEKEKANLKSNLTDLKKIKKELEAEKADLKKYVAKLDGQLESIEQSIAALSSQITNKENEITKTEEELEEALQVEQDQQESMIIRIRLMYEQGGNQVVDVLLASASFGDLLNRIDYIEKVMASDRRMYDDYKASRQLVELCREQLTLEKDILDQTKASVEIEQANLEDLIDQKNQDITKYDSDINTKEKAIKEYEQMIKEQDEEIAALEKAVAAEKKKLLEGSQPVLKYDGGVFKFPLASYKRVSDDYGNRMHPTLGVQQFHNGIDLAASKGTAIYAAYDGKVAAAAYSSTMGNYVMIDHGDELYTIYMHASELYVKKGDTVVRGETVAAVGSTGRSTGNHLHFGVRQSGSYVSPWNYLSQ